MRNVVVALVVAASMSGCAIVTGGRSQTVKVETFDASGKEVKDAKCTLTNRRDQHELRTPASVMITRSDDDMQIICSADGHPEGKGRMISRVGAGIFGNAIIGGGIGAVIDYSSGAAFYYPEWVQMELGQYLTFDRSEHDDGRPTLARTADGNALLAKRGSMPPADPARIKAMHRPSHCDNPSNSGGQECQ